MAGKAIVVDFDQEMRDNPSGRKGFALPRPEQLGQAISDTLYVACVRDYILGADIEDVAKRLRKSPETLKTIISTAPWRRMEYLLREDLKTTVFGRVARIEQTVLDQIEDRLANGDVAYTMGGQEYRAKLNINKLIDLHRRMGETKHNLDRDLKGKKDKEDEADTDEIMAMLEKMVHDQRANDPVKGAIDVTPALSGPHTPGQNDEDQDEDD